jgi:hypothetical protein
VLIPDLLGARGVSFRLLRHLRGQIGHLFAGFLHLIRELRRPLDHFGQPDSSFGRNGRGFGHRINSALLRRRQARLPAGSRLRIAA